MLEAAVNFAHARAWLTAVATKIHSRSSVNMSSTMSLRRDARFITRKSLEIITEAKGPNQTFWVNMHATVKGRFNQTGGACMCGVQPKEPTIPCIETGF